MQNPKPATEMNESKIDDVKSLIQQLKEKMFLKDSANGYLNTYYTCARYSDIIVDTAPYGPLGTDIVYYGPGQWSCMKGKFDVDFKNYRGKKINTKIISVSKLRDANAAIKKELGGEFVMFHPK